MARIRTIKPEFFTSDDTCSLSPLARLLYIGLWCEADRDGRLVWAPKTFRRRYLPEDDCDPEQVAQELVDRGLVSLYGDGLAYIPSFAKHQSVNPRESLSRLPDPHGCNSRFDASNPDEHEQRGREGKGKEEQSIDCLPAERGKPKRKTRLPEDWSATAEQLDYARAQGCSDPSETATRFKLHHLSKGTLGVDWVAGFQYWCRNEKRFPSHGKVAPSDSPIVSRDGDGQWAARTHNWKPGKWWNRGDWGPPPDEPGCRAPSHLIAQWQQETMQ